MLFNSFAFAGLLICTFIFYYQLNTGKNQVRLLIFSSLVFYSYDQIELVLLLLFSSGLNLTVSYLIAGQRFKQRKFLVTIGVIINLAVLGFFKYNPLFRTEILNPDDSLFEFILTIPLPIGISFFTFEGISLLVDVYKEKDLKTKKLASASFSEHAENTLFFISFFPHLVAGPILKAHDFYPQIGIKKFNNISWDQCFENLAMGYFLKMVVADNLKDFTFWIAYPYFEKLSSLNLFVMLMGYSFQIFADFAGYSLIAIGLAKLFGYNFNQNFNFPYISSSYKEFWKRWHISLSSFLMEYLYFPLGGNRKGKIRTYINLMLTMVLGGLWHGAAWSYAVWGAFHGIALAVERFVTDKIKVKETPTGRVFKTVFVFFSITFAWLLFKLPDFNHVIKYLYCLLHNYNINIDFYSISFIIVYSLPVILYHAFYLYNNKESEVQRKNGLSYLTYALIIFLIITNSGSSGSFIYFQF